MSHILIHRLDDIARRRIGRTAQVAALPPQPVRHEGDHWQLNRPGFVHGYVGSRADYRLGRETPELRAAKEAALAAGADPDAVEALTLDDVIVTPELLGGSVGGVDWSVARTTVKAGAATAGGLADYEPSGKTASSIARAIESLPLGPIKKTWEGPPLYGPLIVREISTYGMSATSPAQHTTTLTVEGTGYSVTNMEGEAGWEGFQHAGQTRLDEWVLYGAVYPKIEVNETTILVSNVSIILAISVEYLRRPQ